jgi:GRIP and coiled-coil domain-containing protein 2
LETLKAALADKSTSLVQFKDENKELLDELKEINQVLKERGEVISLQMAKIQQLEKVNVERSQQIVKDKDAAISQLTQELQTLREKVHTTSMADTQSEVLSTSTISKADESARMREIEDSFEEKYFKLKSLAVRLKKKNTEQAAQLLKLEGAQKKEDAVTSEVSAKDVPDSAANEYQAQVLMLKKEKEAFNLAKKELESEIQRLKATIKSKDQELQDGGEAQKTLRAELEKLKVAAKKNNVLSLEMDAYEKSLNDINAKLKAKKIHCEELEGTIDAQTKSIDALKDQIKILEESLEAEKQHAKGKCAAVGLFCFLSHAKCKRYYIWHGMTLI